ncbi:transposase [Deinococcus humi]|uniref:Transposase n=1 Tax=Deinococcus humi TaxID=662880 RepID=A0A7W8NDX3_9DEIO|nr:transposase [Deinococcus humi]
MNSSDLTDAQWTRLVLHLPTNTGRGQKFREHRQVINGILWRAKNGIPWRVIPTEYGPWKTCYHRFINRTRRRIRLSILQNLQALEDVEQGLLGTAALWTVRTSRLIPVPLEPDVSVLKTIRRTNTSAARDVERPVRSICVSMDEGSHVPSSSRLDSEVMGRSLSPYSTPSESLNPLAGPVSDRRISK